MAKSDRDRLREILKQRVRDRILKGKMEAANTGRQKSRTPEFPGFVFKRFFFVMVVAVAILSASVFVALGITGFFVGTELTLTRTTSHTDTVGLEMVGSGAYEWSPASPCEQEGCVLKSARISGTIRANSSGEASVSLDDGDASFSLYSTAFGLNTTTALQNITVEQNVTTTNETTNETSVEVAETVETVETQVEEPAEISFDEVCDETCELAGVPAKVSYTLAFDVSENASLRISGIKYEWQYNETIFQPGEQPLVPNASVAEEDMSNATAAAGNQTENATAPAPVPEIKLDAIGFQPRVGDPNLPAEWFISSETNILDEDAATWEWPPLAGGNQEELFINLMKLNRPEQSYQTPQLKIFSKLLQNEQDMRYILSFDYIYEASGECLQVGTEVFHGDASSLGTFMINMNETGVTNDLTDFNVTLRPAGDWTHLKAAANFLVPNSSSVRFYFASFCDGGAVRVRNFTYGGA